jgi:uncharacterized membrane protein YeiH/ABC-type maltose transport system permease subunit
MEQARRYLDAARGNWAVIFAVFVLVLFVVVPLGFLLVTSLKAGTPGNLGDWSLRNYGNAVASRGLVLEAFGNTIALATVGTLISLLLAGVFAWLVERTDMPFRNVAFTVLLLPIAMPSILFVLAWTVLLAPRTGLLNVPLRDGLGLVGVDLSEGPFNIYTLEGVIFLDSLRGVTTIFLMLIAAFRLFDSTLEEAARVSGAGTFETIRRVTIPLLIPAILAAAMYSFISSMDQFEAALVIDSVTSRFLFPLLFSQTIGSTWYWLVDLVGTVAFALSGAILGWRVGANLAGFFILSALPAVGGGMARDILLDRPIASLQGLQHIAIIGAISLCGYVAYRIHKEIAETRSIDPKFGFLFNVFDAAGLGSFTVTGIAVTISDPHQYSIAWAPFIGALTAAGGGIVRDALVRRRSAALFGELYIQISLLWGGILTIYVFLTPARIEPYQYSNPMWATVLAIILTRLIWLQRRERLFSL